MGEYFSWVNIDRREYIRSGDFSDGMCKLYQTTWYGCMGHRAFCTLIGEEWKGQRMLYLGDQTEANGDLGNPVMKQLIEEYKKMGPNRLSV